jgi:anaerobic ribonucleoside-triphosphate reductase
MEKDSGGVSNKFEFVSKYIRDEGDLKKDVKSGFLVEGFGSSSGEVEVFGSVGEGGSSEESREENKDHVTESISSDKNEKIVSMDKPLLEVKKKFFEDLNDESLTVDTCNKLNRDWKRG